MPSTVHVPVLLEHVLQYLNPQAGESYLDLTAGYGGHAREVLDRTRNPEDTVLVDRDSNAVRELGKVFGPTGKSTDIDIRQKDFLMASRELQAEGRRFDLIMADLGVSSPHLNDATRGFAIAQEGPLDMRMDQTQALSAADIVNGYAADDIADILVRYGEEPKARQIARLIVQNRPYRTTAELASVVARAWPGHSKVHPATRTFQALRIAVNDELRQLEDALPIWMGLLNPGGRLAVISFHSLEDRIVKRMFGEASGDRYDADLRLLTKRPVTADPHETAINPRARSAKLRAVSRLK
jgi:16S rRNA (cytosine1402-N4)-methyltransferase